MTARRGKARTDDAPVLDALLEAPDTHDDDAPAPALPDLVGDADTSLWTAVRQYGALPLVILTILNLVDEIDRVAIIVLGPEIQQALGLSDAALGAIAGLGGFVVVLAAIPLAMLADRGRRVPIVGITAMIWALFAFLTGLVRNTVQLVIVRLLSGIGKGGVEPVHTSLLADYYPVGLRGRVLGAHRTANPIGTMVGPLIAGGAAAIGGWRWAFYVAAPLTVVPAVISFFLREPKRGAHEEASIGLPEELEVSRVAGEQKVPLGTAFRRLMDIQSLKYMYIGIGVLGFGLVGAPVLVSLFLEEVWGLSEFGRGIFFSVGSIGPFVGLMLGGRIGDRLFRHHEAWPLHVLSVAIPTWTVMIVASLYLPQLWLIAVGWNIAGLMLGITLPAFLQLVAATAPPAFRALAFSLFGVFLFIFGGFFGPAILGGVSDVHGPRTALTLIVIPGVIAGVLLARGAQHVRGDIAMVIEDLRQLREAAARHVAGEDGNILEVRGVDFAYGPVQVLFEVDLDVPRGEIVALLGTNGAGKSTVLRLITGLDHPRRGQIRFDGQDITYLEPDQILRLGVAQMPGGKAIFPSLTVEENLEVGAFSFRNDRERVDADIEQVYRWFPVLSERRQQRASTLSGGEQQMLSLGKAFLTKPELLCIDELSLGLAPSVTADLLDIVRQIHARGTTVLIVEQSLNIALSLATVAVFMEKGRVRFSGSAEELSRRDDLVRSVFLGSAKRSRSRSRSRS